MKGLFLNKKYFLFFYLSQLLRDQSSRTRRRLPCRAMQHVRLVRRRAVERRIGAEGWHRCFVRVEASPFLASVLCAVLAVLAVVYSVRLRAAFVLGQLAFREILSLDRHLLLPRGSIIVGAAVPRTARVSATTRTVQTAHTPTCQGTAAQARRAVLSTSSSAT